MLIPCPECNKDALGENVEVDMIYCAWCCRDWTKEDFIKRFGDPYKPTVSVVIKPDMKEALIQKQAEALDCAEYAFQFIIAKGCSCGDEYGLTDEGEHEHKGTCHVLAAKNAMDSIKVKLGET